MELSHPDEAPVRCAMEERQDVTDMKKLIADLELQVINLSREASAREIIVRLTPGILRTTMQLHVSVRCGLQIEIQYTFVYKGCKQFQAIFKTFSAGTPQK